MTDRALDFAKFMVEESDHLTGEKLVAAMVDQFGDLNREQFEREELLMARAAEYQAEADALRAELARRAAA